MLLDNPESNCQLTTFTQLKCINGLPTVIIIEVKDWISLDVVYKLN